MERLAGWELAGPLPVAGLDMTVVADIAEVAVAMATGEISVAVGIGAAAGIEVAVGTEVVAVAAGTGTAVELYPEAGIAVVSHPADRIGTAAVLAAGTVVEPYPVDTAGIEAVLVDRFPPLPLRLRKQGARTPVAGKNMSVS